MLRIYKAEKNQFALLERVQDLVVAPDDSWLDLISPTPEEERILEKKLGIDLPTREEMRDIEPSSRLYEENGALYMTATVLWKADTNEPESANIAFVLTKNLLITIRYSEPKPFKAFTQYAEKQGNSCNDAASTFIALLEATIDRAAEILELTSLEVDNLTRTVFAAKNGKPRKSGELEHMLHNVALQQNITAKVRESLVSLGRAISFAAHARSIKENGFYAGHMESLLRDIQSLTDHASFLTNNISFMLDAALGLINIEQNAIIKIFSVAAVVFLPPTLVASIYGMNFKTMPELGWDFGYPFAIGLMILSAILPYLFFKRKGWL